MDALVACIERSPRRASIVDMFVKGPPENAGFMWADRENTAERWTDEEFRGFEEASALVIAHRYESAAYGWMMRRLQRHFVAESFVSSIAV